jgi:hypothetical protein
MDPTELFQLVLDQIGQHPRYSVLLANAVAAQEQLILNYHAHAPGEPYCVSVGVLDGALPALNLPGEFRELAHVRGIGRDAGECELLMSTFASLLQQRYELRNRPKIYLQGEPLRST